MMADLIVVIHFLFVLFVVCGGALALWWPRVVWVHVPAVVWGVWIELSGSICPLTPLENRLRRARGDAGYEGDFIAHYILPVLYPEGLTRSHQLTLGALALSINLAVYAVVFARRRRRPAKDL
jgi:hypothetical protein